MSTTPTIETLLDRLNEWGERFITELKELKGVQQAHGNVLGELPRGQKDLQSGQKDLRTGQEELRKGQEALRNDLNAGLRRVERKIEILNDSILTVNADIRDLEIRLEKMEAESLTKS